jgi:uncharacterized protein (DUF697 family)
MKLPSLPGIGSSLGIFGTVVSTVREVDVRGIRAAADESFSLAVTSRDMPLAEHIANALYTGPNRQALPARRASSAISLEQAESLARGLDLAVIVTREDADNAREIALVKQLQAYKVPTVVCFVVSGGPPQPNPLRSAWLPAKIVELPEPISTTSAQHIVKAVRAFKKIDDIALARHLPSFRDSVCKSLTDDCANANAAYSFSTGLVEVVPGVNVALNAADMFVLTKNQMIMCYKIALAMGITGEFKDVAPKLAAVLGGGFFFRQVSRSLAGLIPGIGIVPKVAVAYAGTHAAGQAIMRWCATGETLSTDALQAYFHQAISAGRSVAERLLGARRATTKPKPGKGIPELKS